MTIRGTAVPKPAKKDRSSHATAEGKAAQRARNGNATRSGSSGVGLATRGFHTIDWAEVEPEAIHIVDIAARIGTSMSNAAGGMQASLYTSREYAHALLEAQIGCPPTSAVFVRIYHIPLPMVYDGGPDDSDDGDGD